MFRLDKTYNVARGRCNRSVFPLVVAKAEGLLGNQSTEAVSQKDNGPSRVHVVSVHIEEGEECLGVLADAGYRFVPVNVARVTIGEDPDVWLFPGEQVSWPDYYFVAIGVGPAPNSVAIQAVDEY